jgi:hypothetical protein
VVHRGNCRATARGFGVGGSATQERTKDRGQSVEMTRRDLIAAMAVALAAGGTFADMPSAADGIRKAARDAWLYVLPLIDVAARRARPYLRDGRPGPINAFTHERWLAGPESRGVTTPNNDTLYSNAFIDTTAGPVWLQIPDCHKRYLSVQIMDMYTNNNFILSPRLEGGAAGRWRIIAPGSIPRGARDLRVATPHAWVVARVLVDGPTDLPAAHAAQDRLALLGHTTAPPVSYATSASDWPSYFAAAEHLLESDPPPSKKGLDAFMSVRNMGRGRAFARGGYTPETAAAIDRGVAEAAAVARSAGRRQDFVSGWTYPRPDLGEYGDDFIFRAIVATAGLGALNPSEAMYMRSAGDGRGLFEGEGLYRFSLPGPIPVDAFWSLTLYEATSDGRFFLTENALHRYAIGDRTEGLRRVSGGALDIWIGRANPGGERTHNWLPAPKQGPFSLIFRAYLPRTQLLNGSFRLPAVVRI